MSRRRLKRAPRVTSKFKLGDLVRVKRGVMDDEYPDIPLGGWAGSITEVLGSGSYTVRWTAQTLRNIPAVYKKRCERDDMVLEEYCFTEEDLEPDFGGPLEIEKPTRIITRPLSSENQADRVRAAFGLTSDDPLPAPDHRALRKYRKYLTRKLRFPLEATYSHDGDHADSTKIVVVGLDPDSDEDEYDGLYCEVRGDEETDLVPLTRISPLSRDDHQLVDDYGAWFWDELEGTCGTDFEDDEEEDEDEWDEEELEGSSPSVPLNNWYLVAFVILKILAFGACYGAVLGASFAAIPWTLWPGIIAAILWGSLCAVARQQETQQDWPFASPRARKGCALTVGGFFGALQGGFFGTAVVAFIGPLAGAFAGAWLGRKLPRKRTRSGFVPVFPGNAILGAACGLVVQAFYQNAALALEGSLRGAAVGLGAIPVLFVLMVFAAYLFGDGGRVEYRRFSR